MSIFKRRDRAPVPSQHVRRDDGPSLCLTLLDLLESDEDDRLDELDRPDLERLTELLMRRVADRRDASDLPDADLVRRASAALGLS